MSNELRRGEEKYTYFKIDFKECPTFDFDYTICTDLNEVSDYIMLVEGDLDANERASVTITGVAMTDNEWRKWQKENVKP